MRLPCTSCLAEHDRDILSPIQASSKRARLGFIKKGWLLACMAIAPYRAAASPGDIENPWTLCAGNKEVATTNVHEPSSCFLQRCCFCTTAVCSVLGPVQNLHGDLWLSLGAPLCMGCRSTPASWKFSRQALYPLPLRAPPPSPTVSSQVHMASGLSMISGLDCEKVCCKACSKTAARPCFVCCFRKEAISKPSTWHMYNSASMESKLLTREPKFKAGYLTEVSISRWGEKHPGLGPCQNLLDGLFKIGNIGILITLHFMLYMPSQHHAIGLQTDCMLVVPPPVHGGTHHVVRLSDSHVYALWP